MCDETESKFKLNYNCNITKMMDNNEIDFFMSDDEIYNKVKLHMKLIPFGSFPPENTKIGILLFVINTPIIDNLNNKKVFQQLDNLDMLRLIKEYISVTTLFDVFFVDGTSFGKKRIS